MSDDWILLNNTAVRKANVFSIRGELSSILGMVYHVTLTNGDKLTLKETDAGGYWCYLQVQVGAKAGWAAKAQFIKEQNMDKDSDCGGDCDCDDC